MNIIQKWTHRSIQWKSVPLPPLLSPCLITKMFSSEAIVLLGSYVSFQDHMFLFNTVTDIWIYFPSFKFLNIRVIKVNVT